MRIAVIGPLGFPATGGGMSRHCEELYARLAARGHQVTVFCRSGYGTADGTWRGMTLRPLRVLRAGGWETLGYALAASLRSLGGRFDVVHYHALPSSGFCFLPRLAGRRVVVTVHAREWASGKWGRAARGYLRLAEWEAVRLAHAVIAVSRALRDDLERRHGVPGRVHHIPNGLPPLVAPDAARVAALGLEPRGYLLFVGRIAPEKGLHVLVEALGLLGEEVVLAVAGAPRYSGRYLDELRGRAGPAVRFLGPQPWETLASLYAHALALVAPSFGEGLPLAVLEAARYGCGVVASDIPAHREVLGEDALFVPPGSPPHLAEALRAVVADPGQVAGMGRRVRERLERSGEYDWDRVADQTERVLRSL